jgi:hypothetical protein
MSPGFTFYKDIYMYLNNIKDVNTIEVDGNIYVGGYAVITQGNISSYIPSVVGFTGTTGGIRFENGLCKGPA